MSELNKTSILARCPFYQTSWKKNIFCEGAFGGSTIHVRFNHPEDGYTGKYCCNNWNNCPIARMLWAKYDDVSNMDQFTGNIIKVHGMSLRVWDGE